MTRFRHRGQQPDPVTPSVPDLRAAAPVRRSRSASQLDRTRHVELEDLPPAVAERLRFDRAAPRRLRSERLPQAIRDELEDLWDGIIADVYDEVAGVRRTKAFGREGVLRALERVSDRLLQAERVVIFTASHYPIRGDSDRKHVAVGALGAGASAAVEEIASFGTAGTATTVAIVSAIVGEVFEAYVAASMRAGQYKRQHWPAEPDAILLDLAEAAGYSESAGRRATTAMAHDAVRWLGGLLATRTAARFARGLMPVIGIGVGAGTSAYNLQKVRRLALRPPSGTAVENVILDLLNDPAAYARARDEYLAIAPDHPPARGGGPSQSPA